MSGPVTAPAGWYGDPAGRHQYRYWDGSTWTGHVADAGVAASDPLTPAPTAQAAAPAPVRASPAASAATSATGATEASLTADPFSPAPVTPAAGTPAPFLQTPSWQPSTSQASSSQAPGWPFTSPAAPASPAAPVFPTAASPAPPGRRGRGKWLLVSAIAVVVIGLAAGLLIWAPWRPPPLLRPAGLTAGAVTTGSLEFRWAGPASGPPPDRYLIVHDGKVIASVPGTVTSYRAAGLAPDTSYSYRVVAERDGKRSPQSRLLVLTTAIPPLSAARVDGTWSVHIKIIHGAGSLTGGPRSWNESWQTNPKCASGPCAVKLFGTLNGHTFTVTLHRAGAAYRGKTVANVFPCGGGANSFAISSTLKFRVKVTAANVDGGVWTASSWKGTLGVFSPYTASGNFFCNAAHQTIALSGAP